MHFPSGADSLFSVRSRQSCGKHGAEAGGRRFGVKLKHGHRWRAVPVFRWGMDRQAMPSAAVASKPRAAGRGGNSGAAEKGTEKRKRRKNAHKRNNSVFWLASANHA